MHSLISNFIWYIFNLSVEHFCSFVIDQWEPLWLLVGTDLVVQEPILILVLTFQLLLDCETVIFFFLLFFLCQFLSYFYFFFVSFHGIFRRIFASLPSLTHSPTPPSHPSAPDKRERPFCFAPDHSFDYSALLAYAKRTGCFVV